jgi:hypothetical protein
LQYIVTVECNGIEGPANMKEFECDDGHSATKV